MYYAVASYGTELLVGGPVVLAVYTPVAKCYVTSKGYPAA